MSSEPARRTECEDKVFHFTGIPANSIAAGEVVEAIFVLVFGDSEVDHDVFRGSSAERGPTSEELHHEVIFTSARVMLLWPVRHFHSSYPAASVNVLSCVRA